MEDFVLGRRVFGNGGVLFSRSVYLWFLFVGVLFIPILETTFGTESYTYRTAAQPTRLNNVVYILTYKPYLYKWFYGVFMLSSLLSFLNLGGIVSRGLVWFTSLVLAMGSYMSFNAGVLLAYNWAFYLIFFFPSLDKDWKIVLSNFSILAARCQFLIVYAFAAYYKWFTEDWIHGDAVHFLSLTDHFTPEWLSTLLQSMPLLMTILSYTVLLYLTLFPVLIWFKKSKSIILLIGLGFHLYTMFIMQLYDFGLIMIIGYLLFLSKEQIDKLQRKLPFLMWHKKLKIKVTP